MTAGDGRPIESSTSGLTNSDHLLALDGMRGIAALLVMFHHSYWVLGFNPAPSAHLAVDFFFVLSGFVVALATERWMLRGDTTIAMLGRRVERLWPIYLIGLCLGLLAVFGTQNLGLGGVIKAFIKAGINAFFIPVFPKDGGKLFPFDVPTWSLFFEVVANALFIVLVRQRMKALTVAIAFSSAMLLACLVRDLGSADGGYDLETILIGFARVGTSFFAGAGLYYLWQRVGKPRTASALGLFLSLSLCVVSFLLPPGRAKDLLSIFLLFPATVFLGASVRLPSWLQRPARVSGDISYPLYVIHLPIIVLATAIWQAAVGGRPTDMPKYVVLIIWIAICLTALWLERAVQPPGRRLIAALVGRLPSLRTQRVGTVRQLEKTSLQTGRLRTGAPVRSWAIVGGGAAISLLSLSLAVAYLWPPGKPIVRRDEPRCDASAGYSSSAGIRTYLLRPDLLQSAVNNSGAPRQANVRELIAAANEALTHAPYSVMEKSVIAPSGDKHDYVSLDNYSWQDASSPTGWTWRDGHFNPAYTGPAFDYGRLWSLVNDAQTLALAYNFTHDRRYSRHLESMIRAWFLDPATRMNPNQSYAQIIPGTKSETNGNGSIDGWRFVFLIDAVGLVQNSGDIRASEIQGLRDWFSHYLVWMNTSAQGQHEFHAKGNHAVYYDIQRIDFALFTGQDQLAHRFAENATIRTLQIDQQGELPQELAREDKPHYIVFGSNAFADLASLSACAGVDLWNYRRPFRGYLPRLYASLAEYVAGVKPWPSKHAFREPEPAAAALSQASWAYHNADFGRAALSLERMKPDPDPYERWVWLMYPPYLGRQMAPPG